MKTLLNKCRKSESTKCLKNEAVNTILLFSFGLMLGVFAKWLDSMAIDNNILWQQLLGILDLRNVFSRLSIWALLAVVISVYSKRATRAGINVGGFFLGMFVGYYTYTIFISGFFPRSYMLAWGFITLFTPVLAFIIWYAKGAGWFAVVLSAIIIGFFFSQAFSFGMWYFNILYFAEVLCFLFAILTLYRDRQQFFCILLGAIVFAPFIEMLTPCIFGGL